MVYVGKLIAQSALILYMQPVQRNYEQLKVVTDRVHVVFRSVFYIPLLTEMGPPFYVYLCVLIIIIIITIIIITITCHAHTKRCIVYTKYIYKFLDRLTTRNIYIQYSR